MTISASEIDVGKCYVTGYSEMRRVVAVDFIEVTYETDASDRSSDSSSRRVTISREKFAAEVDREVACPNG